MPAWRRRRKTTPILPTAASYSTAKWVLKITPGLKNAVLSSAAGTISYILKRTWVKKGRRRKPL